MSFRGLLNTTVNIKRKTLTADGQGGHTSAWATIYRRVPCRFNALGSPETTLTYDKQAVFANYYVYLEHLTGIKEEDRLVLGSREFEVKLIQDWDEANNYMKLSVLEIDRNE